MRDSVLLLLLLVVFGLLQEARTQKLSALTFLRVDQDKECNMDCSSAQRKPLCASDGRNFASRCEFQRAKCRDPQLEVMRGSCKETSRCVAEKKYTEQQAKKLFPQVFVPVCNPDGTYSECHSFTGYCWCVTPNGRPISGTAVANKKPRCQGSQSCSLVQHMDVSSGVSDPLWSSNRRLCGNKDRRLKSLTQPLTRVIVVSLQIFSILNADESVILAEETQPPPDEEDITSQYPTLWTEQVRSRQNRTRTQSSSCDQEQLTAQEEARQHKNEAVFIPDCAHGGLYKPVQCHPSTGYCWCVLIDTGRPIPGTSTRYEQPKCDGNARAHPNKPKDLYRSRHLQGCPGSKKTEFLTSVLDALSTDMVHAVTDPAAAGRMPEPDPNHTLEERVVHWYFSQLDKNLSGDIGKKEIKPFRRLLRKKSKPKKCVKKFVEYCDISNDKALSLQELIGCLGVMKEEEHGEKARLRFRTLSLSAILPPPNGDGPPHPHPHPP
ncbi:SPARC-related modular calcium-binding protein 2 [Bagarius yarrelli]|uniref:SPARC-related modular calcium-binding protein 2 n=1 Tax=Bagarius yarrelli TaxID=175774 RepID=A0A556V444_BAGYA|nr:SPARC-related modular calcium-binding protein 2 [Bagarius yarrelli]